METKIILYGASGHAKVIASILKANGVSDISVVDDDTTKTALLDFKVTSLDEVIQTESTKFIITVGNNQNRYQLAEKINREFANAIHPSAVLSEPYKIGHGVVVMANVCVNASASIGNHVILNTGCLVEHDCIIEDFAHISPKAALAGNVTVGMGAQVGINATVIQGVKIGKWATVGAGAVVVRDVPDYAVVVGNPARIIKYNPYVASDNVSFRIIKDHEMWLWYIQHSKYADFYHTYEYHNLETEEEKILLVATFESYFIAYPLLSRVIPKTIYRDVTSVYGYVGPITSHEIALLPAHLISFFQEQLKQYFNENQIVAAFSRLHPLIDSTLLFNNFGKIRQVNHTVTVDLKQPIENIKQNYRKTIRNEVKQLSNKGFVMKIAKDDSEIDQFIQIYLDSMRRVNANKYYFFEKAYFYSLLKNNDFKSVLVLSYYQEQITAGAIFTIQNNIMQYHLAGTHKDFMKAAPMKGIIDFAIQYGKENNVEYLHLGGGFAGSDTDSLFLFKAGFSPLRTTFSVWEYIADEEVYHQLSKDVQEKTDFFPKYRSIRES